MDVPHDQGNCAFDPPGRCREGIIAGLRTIDDAFKAENPEVSPAGREIGIGNLGNRGKRHLFLIIRFAAHPDWIPMGWPAMQGLRRLPGSGSRMASRLR